MNSWVKRGSPSLPRRMMEKQTKSLGLLRLKWERRKIPHKQPSHLIFLYAMRHITRDCLKKEKLNIVIDAKEDNNELETPMRVNPIQFLNAI